MSNIVNFWREFTPVEGKPMVHHKDKAILGADYCECFSYQEYINDLNFGVLDDHRFHLGLLPAPYIGDISKAKIYILMLNPGFGLSNYYEEDQQDIKEAIVNNLYQNNLGKYPFFLLDPKFLWTDGGKYWATKLKACINEISNLYNLSYIDTLKLFSQNIALIDLYPYHSAKFKLSARIRRKLESKNRTMNFVHEELVPKAMQGEVCIIVTRQVKVWDLPDHNNIIKYTGGEAIAAHLSLRTRGGQKIVEYMSKIIEESEKG